MDDSYQEEPQHAPLDESRTREIVRSCHERLGRPFSPYDLEELVQDTLVAAWEGAPSFRGEGVRDAWIYGIARHQILGRLRRRRSRKGREDPLLETDLASAPGGPRSRHRVGTATAHEIRGTLAAAGTTVDTIFRQHSIDGETFARIADDLGMKETAVKARYYRSIPALRQRLRRLFDRSRT